MIDPNDLRFDIIGVNSVDRTAHAPLELNEVRIRVAGRAPDAQLARRIGSEVEALYTNGPAGGGGAFASTREVIAVASTLIDRNQLAATVHYEAVP